MANRGRLIEELQVGIGAIKSDPANNSTTTAAAAAAAAAAEMKTPSVFAITVPSRRYPTLAAAVKGVPSSCFGEGSSSCAVISVLEGKYELPVAVALRGRITIQAKPHVNGNGREKVTLSFAKAPGVELLHPGASLVGVSVAVQAPKPYGRQSFAVVMNAPDTVLDTCTLRGGGLWVKCGTAPAVVVRNISVHTAAGHGLYVTESNTRRHVFRAEYSARRRIQRDIVERQGAGRDVYDWEFDADEDDDELAAELAELAEAATRIGKVVRGWLTRSALRRRLILHGLQVHGAQQNGLFVDGSGTFGEMHVRVRNANIELCGSTGVRAQGQAQLVISDSSIRNCAHCGLAAQTPDTHTLVRSVTFKRCKEGGVKISDSATAHVTGCTFDNNGGVPIEVWGKSVEQFSALVKKEESPKSDEAGAPYGDPQPPIDDTLVVGKVLAAIDEAPTDTRLTTKKQSNGAEDSAPASLVESQAANKNVAQASDSSTPPDPSQAAEKQPRHTSSPANADGHDKAADSDRIPGTAPQEKANAPETNKSSLPGTQLRGVGTSPPPGSINELRVQLAALDAELDRPFDAAMHTQKINQIHYEMQQAIDEGEFKWAGVLREMKAVMERGEEGYLGDLAVRRTRLAKMLHAMDTGIRDISVAADTFEHKPFRPIKSTRQRIENQRAHDAALKERHERLKEIEELARKRAKFEVSHIPSDVEVRIRAPSFLFPSLQDAVAACPRDRSSAIIVPDGCHHVEGVLVLDRPVVLYGARGGNAVLCVHAPPAKLVAKSSRQDDDPEAAARNEAARQKRQRQLRERNLREAAATRGRGRKSRTKKLIVPFDLPVKAEDRIDPATKLGGAINIAHKDAGLNSLHILVLPSNNGTTGDAEAVAKIDPAQVVCKATGRTSKAAVSDKSVSSASDAMLQEDAGGKVFVPALDLSAAHPETPEATVASVSHNSKDSTNEGTIGLAGEGNDPSAPLEMQLRQKNIVRSSFLPFEEAREFVRRLGITEPNLHGWLSYCSKQGLPPDIPFEPQLIYARHGWVSMQDWIGGNLEEMTRIVKNEVTAAEIAEARRVAEQAAWDTAVTGSVAILICSEHVLVTDCSVTGGCIWVNLGGVFRQNTHGIQGQTAKVVNTFVVDSPGCGLLVTGRKSTPVVERCTFKRCSLAGVCAQQEGRPTVSECTLEANHGFGAKWWRQAAGYLVSCVINRNESAGVFVLGEGTSPRVEACTFEANRGIGLYVSGGAGGTYNANVQQQHAYCGFKVTKSCTRALVTENVDRDALEREQAASREAARKAREAVEAAALKLAADKLDEERRLRKIYGKDWQRHSKLQPASRASSQAKNQTRDDRAMDDEKPTFDLEYADGDLESKVPFSLLRASATVRKAEEKAAHAEQQQRADEVSREEEKQHHIQLVKKKLQAAGNLFDDDWAALFEKCDTRGEGALDLADFIKALRNVCRLSAKMLPKVQIKEVFEAVDLDHGGDIDVEEFTEFLNDQEEDSDSDSALDSDNDTLGSATPFGSEVDLLSALGREKAEAAEAAKKQVIATHSTVAKGHQTQKQAPREREFHVGDEVEARYGGKKKWFKAVIIKVHPPKQRKPKSGALGMQRKLSAAQKQMLANSS